MNEESPLIRSKPPSARMTLESTADSAVNGLGNEAIDPRNQEINNIETFDTVDPGSESSDIDNEGGQQPVLDEGSTNVSPSSPEKRLGVWSMAVLVFYSVSGGPFGIETTVRAGGNFYAILGFLVMPFCWSLQEALMTAELGTAFPEASGGVAWVEEAFGPLAGWMAGYLSWVGGATGEWATQFYLS